MNYKILIILLCSLIIKSQCKKLTVMISPAGDAQYAGRTIDNTFERGITLQCVQKLKQELESRNSKIRIVLTRIPGETIQDLQNASFSNRLNVDLYISINFFTLKSGNPSLFLYYFSLNSDAHSWNITANNLSFTPYNKAHLENLSLTKTIINNIFQLFDSNYKKIFTTHKPLGIPFKPLVGIKSPALGIEISLQKNNDWIIFLPALTESIEKALKCIKNKEGI